MEGSPPSLNFMRRPPMLTLNTAEDAARLLKQAQERIGERVRFVPLQPLHWRVVFDDGGAFQIEWSDTWGRLVLIAELGVPSVDGERQALNLALAYNAQWRQVGNLRMARDSDDGELILIGELGREAQAPETFDAALLHFEGLRRWWGGVLMHVGSEAVEPPPPNLLANCV